MVAVDAHRTHGAAKRAKGGGTGLQLRELPLVGQVCHFLWREVARIVSGAAHGRLELERCLYGRLRGFNGFGLIWHDFSCLSV